MIWQEILLIVVPIMGMMAWVYNRIEKKADERSNQVNKQFEKIDARFEKIDARFEKIDARFDQIDEKLHALDMRLTRLEGRFDERGYWESREWHKTGTEDKK